MSTPSPFLSSRCSGACVPSDVNADYISTLHQCVENLDVGSIDPHSLTILGNSQNLGHNLLSIVNDVSDDTAVAKAAVYLESDSKITNSTDQSKATVLEINGMGGATAVAVTDGNLVVVDDFSVGGNITLTDGGAVVQATSKATIVILSERSGKITMHGAALNTGVEVSFTVTNTTVSAADVILVNHASGGTGGAYLVQANTVSAGKFRITVSNASGGNLSEAIVLQFAAIRITNA